ncbi:ion channel [Agaribacterium sp. ZY112]|uniref:ion channel n=1 Tax=Agaribacterium sp. ZY112 TaxID=3233574 RepID=UPI003523D22A
MPSELKHCQYRGPNSEYCDEPIYKGEKCFWHDTSEDKHDQQLIKKLEQRARSGKPMIGFCLRKANLQGIDLVHHGSALGYELKHADLYRANLSYSHLFNLRLDGSSLMKADLNHANLNRSSLCDTNLLGINLEGAKLDNVNWSQAVKQEHLAQQHQNGSCEQNDLLEQAEEVYRNLRRIMESQGLFENAGLFFQKEMVMRRLQLPKFSLKRALSKLVDLFCGYGEEPVRVVLFSFVIILTFSLLYFIAGVSAGDELIQIDGKASLRQNLSHFLQVLYFSVVTFTTLGYGDLSPIGITRLFAALEAFIGSFTLALFVVVFVKKMTR